VTRVIRAPDARPWRREFLTNAWEKFTLEAATGHVLRGKMLSKV
jgi:hypothetical protein